MCCVGSVAGLYIYNIYIYIYNIYIIYIYRRNQESFSDEKNEKQIKHSINAYRNTSTCPINISKTHISNSANIIYSFVPTNRHGCRDVMCNPAKFNRGHRTTIASQENCQ